MNRFIFVVVLFVGVAARAQTFTVEPAMATLAVQQDGTCRGHITYLVVEAGVLDELGQPVVEQGVIEIKAPCARLTNLTSGETFDTSGGKLSLSAPRARVVKHFTDPDADGPRIAGECELEVSATATIRKRSFEVSRVRRAALCAPLTNVVADACWVARGSWHDAASFPAIPKCP